MPENFETLSATICRAAVDGGDAGRLKASWVYRCLFTPDPLGERLTLMWHNHFATSLQKVNDLNWMLQQNETFRKYARGDFHTLLAAMFEDPALLKWLDAPENKSGHPNENLAREAMELFALGIGHYAEADIREAARALTGLTIEDGVVVFDALQHDAAEKTIFGKSGHYEPRDLPDLLTAHPANSRRLAWRLCHEFCGEGVVDDAALKELATELRSNELRIDRAVETILRSRIFFHSTNLHSRVADPVSYLLGLLRAVESDRNPPSTLAVVDCLRRIGMDLFAPPNVGGWLGGRAWLSTRTVIGRNCAVTDFVYGRLHLPAAPLNFEPLLNRHRVGDTLVDAIRFFGSLFQGHIDDRLVDQLVQAVEGEPDRANQLRQVVVMLLTQPAAIFTESFHSALFRTMLILARESTHAESTSVSDTVGDGFTGTAGSWIPRTFSGRSTSPCG